MLPSSSDAKRVGVRINIDSNCPSLYISGASLYFISFVVCVLRVPISPERKIELIPRQMRTNIMTKNQIGLFSIITICGWFGCFFVTLFCYLCKIRTTIGTTCNFRRRFRIANESTRANDDDATTTRF